MPSGRVIFACSLVASAAIHAVVWWKAPRYYGHPGRPKPKTPIPTLTILPPDEHPPQPLKSVFGESTGTGVAINASEGDAPQAGPKPDADQAANNRDDPGEQAAAPRERTAAKPLTQAVTAPPPAALPAPPLSPLLAFRKPEPPAPPAASLEKPSPSQDVAATPAPPESPTSPSPPRDIAAAEVAAPAGKPLPKTDRDSDPVAKTFAPEFKRGRVVASRGRSFKFTNPKISLRAFADAHEVVFPATLVLSVTLEPTGRPRSVVVKQSAGSRSIDRAFVLAAYDSWFEPVKDDHGAAVGDEFEFPIKLGD